MPDQERINNAADPIYQEFPGVSPFDTSPRVGLRKSELEDPKVQRELDGVKTSIDAIVEERMAGFDERNPDAPPEDRAIAEAGTRALVDRLLNLPNPSEIDTQINESYGHHAGKNELHEERLDAIVEAGELATEQDVKVIPETATTDARVAALEAYAMKPYEDEMAKDRAANSTPVQYIPGEDGQTHQIGGVDLPTELKQKHWRLEGQAESNAKEAVRLDKIAGDPSRDQIERQEAQEYLDILTNPDSKIAYDPRTERITAVADDSSHEEKSTEEFDTEEWAKQHEHNMDPEQSKALYETIRSLQRNLSANWEPARKGELPKEAKDQLRTAGLAALNITRRIIEEHFDSEFVLGLEKHGQTGNRKYLQQLFNTLSSNSQFLEEVKIPATGEAHWTRANVDIYADPQKAIQCLTHAYDEARKNINDPRAIAYGDIAMRILEGLRSHLGIRVQEADKAKFEQTIASLQVNERAVSQAIK
jgi:hypothetical protein